MTAEIAMRTTLDIADDVLFAAKEIAQREKKPLGTIISDLARIGFIWNTPIAIAWRYRQQRIGRPSA
jgi:hypothetical protein